MCRAIFELAVAGTICATAIYYFSVYAFDNPDSGSCYAADNSIRASPVSVNRGNNVDDASEADMADAFGTWFKWGVVTYSAYFCIRFFMFVGALQESFAKVTIGHILSIALFLLSVLWTIDGTAARFSHNGEVCSGTYFPEMLPAPPTDTSAYLLKSGEFMKYYLIGSWIATGIFLVFFFVCCAVSLIITL